jgi:hypothetical protein
LKFAGQLGWVQQTPSVQNSPGAHWDEEKHELPLPSGVGVGVAVATAQTPGGMTQTLLLQSDVLSHGSPGLLIWQEPFFPGMLHDMPAGHCAALQQTPSVQKPEMHSKPDVHGEPFCCGGRGVGVNVGVGVEGGRGSQRPSRPGMPQDSLPGQSSSQQNPSSQNDGSQLVGSLGSLQH